MLGSTIKHIKPILSANVDKLQNIFRTATSMLAFLHKNGIVHKSLNDSNVYVDNHGNIRLANFSIFSYLSWLTTGIKRESVDLVALGNLVDSLLVSSDSNHVQNFVEMCKSARTLSAQDLQEHEFLNAQKPTSDLDEKKEQSTCVNKHIPPIKSSNVTDTVSSVRSRLNEEFEILKYLGKGAYGDVLKVKKILDNRLYALKRIPLPASNRQIFKKITREVELLSRLNHENVVRYYNSWIEVGEDEAIKNVMPTNDSSINLEIKQVNCKNLIQTNESSSSSDWLDK